jgi:hypothetical protein
LQIQEALHRQQLHFDQLKAKIAAKKPDELKWLKEKVEILTRERDEVRADLEKLKAVVVKQDSEVKARESEIRKLTEDGETVKATLNEKLDKSESSLAACQVNKNHLLKYSCMICYLSAV